MTSSESYPKLQHSSSISLPLPSSSSAKQPSPSSKTHPCASSSTPASHAPPPPPPPALNHPMAASPAPPTYKLAMTDEPESENDDPHDSSLPLMVIFDTSVTAFSPPSPSSDSAEGEEFRKVAADAQSIPASSSFESSALAASSSTESHVSTSASCSDGVSGRLWLVGRRAASSFCGLLLAGIGGQHVGLVATMIGEIEIGKGKGNDLLDGREEGEVKAKMVCGVCSIPATEKKAPSAKFPSPLTTAPFLPLFLPRQPQPRPLPQPSQREDRRMSEDFKGSPYRRHRNDDDLETRNGHSPSGIHGGGGGDDGNSGPFDIVRTKSASVDRLKRWRQAALVLNASRRFRYTLDLKREEEKKQIIAKIRTHAQVIRVRGLAEKLKTNMDKGVHADEADLLQ
ncbi:hypothetical protein RJ639_018799 [Escallonia herrerae]|uniref:Calcium-transporting P-type ATPase N-terminal autoinhibitory domain-containing protein n=1 Tax=Escallonia herrerae TaxID=1293975 RepID=A0AA89AHZ2_9ASTE|nr:hypothetical protein RJ639_018799 [Escallonia herrerae]